LISNIEDTATRRTMELENKNRELLQEIEATTKALQSEQKITTEMRSCLASELKRLNESNQKEIQKMKEEHAMELGQKVKR
jgi:DNA anti-recombination protein RmuC